MREIEELPQTDGLSTEFEVRTSRLFCYADALLASLEVPGATELTDAFLTTLSR